jgi:hypothetical protein
VQPIGHAGGQVATAAQDNKIIIEKHDGIIMAGRRPGKCILAWKTKKGAAGAAPFRVRRKGKPCRLG